MAYQTGATTTVSALITALLTFATSNGFTVGANWTSGTYSVATLSKNGIYYVFQYKSDVLQLNTALSLNSGSLAIAQGGAASENSLIYPIAGPHVSYHFFADSHSINVVVEIGTNIFTHFNFGEITKNGGWVGGAFVTGSSSYNIPSPAQLPLLSGYITFPWYSDGNPGSSNNSLSSYSHMRSDALSTNGICGFCTTVISNAQNTVYNTAWAPAMGKPLLDIGPNASNGRVPIVPISILQSTSGTSAPYFQSGYISNAGVINIAAIDPKSIVNTDWMVFPIGQKGNASSTFINSGNYAMAYKK